MRFCTTSCGKQLKHEIRGLGAICFFTFWITLICALGDQAGESPKMNRLRGVATDESPTNGLGDWVWAEKTLDRQTVQFWNSFESHRMWESRTRGCA